MALHGSFRQIITTHAPGDTDGSKVQVIANPLTLKTGLDGNAAFSPIFASVGVPAKSDHILTPAGISDSMALAPSVVTPNGVNAQVTDLAPNFKVGMHRSNSIDYNVFVSGHAYLITPSASGEEERTLVTAGEVVVQRGTLHAWEAGPEGARWVTVVVAALPVEVGGKPLEEVDF
ncbi:uncharacterized protein EHS24_007711 [Apiotrichum porosum]|uniref:Cupin 2 conserved barrel domain-containing protein n=1 Tax=Apiotrichum porosum TaxID=105984 RepID=A0A427XV87_9TREE|nr:uncharacterized protein EHS24_007711 [Apiotrichum porosum]RSH82717.1 hypothetical protein EHS24_007711 [Apiotrichum porosum]